MADVQVEVLADAGAARVRVHVQHPAVEGLHQAIVSCQFQRFSQRHEQDRILVEVVLARAAVAVRSGRGGVLDRKGLVLSQAGTRRQSHVGHALRPPVVLADREQQAAAVV